MNHVYHPHHHHHDQTWPPGWWPPLLGPGRLTATASYRPLGVCYLVLESVSSITDRIILGAGIQVSVGGLYHQQSLVTLYTVSPPPHTRARAQAVL